MMFPKRKGALVRCYKDGVPIGEKPTPEWEKELGIPRQSIYDSTFKGSIARGHYLFMKVKAEDDEPEPPKHPTLSEVNAEAKAQGKTYAQLQMEETLEMIRPPKSQPDITFGRLADMIDSTCLLDVREHDEFDAEHTIFTALTDSKVFQIAEIRDMAVDYFAIDWTMQTVRVYVK